MAEATPDTNAPAPARTSVVAGIAQRVAIFGGFSVVAGIGAAQLGLPAMVGFMIYVAGALFGGFVAFALGALGLFFTRGGKDPLGRKNAITGLAAGLGLLAIVFIPSSRAGDLPPINDITTDTANPPSFAAGTGAPEFEGRDMSYPEEFGPQVREAYPDLIPIVTDLAPDAAFAKAKATAEELGWEIVWASEEAGAFIALERTSLCRFVDDVVVRVRPESGGARLDLRSKSRDGRGDLGANAARIRRFTEAYGA